MKRILIILPLLVGCIQSPEPEEIPQWSCVELLRNQHKEELSEWNRLILAIAYTESKFHDDAVGTSGDFGQLQITQIFVDEANRISGQNFKHEDAFNIDSSLAMFDVVQSHYNAERDIDKAIALHNRSPYYKKTVLENLEMINRAEELRAKLLER